MDQMQVLAAMAAFTTAIVGAVKKAFPVWTPGKEELLAIAVPLVIVPIMKFVHVVDLSWANVVVTILFSGAGAGILHDKIVNGLIKKKTEVK